MWRNDLKHRPDIQSQHPAAAGVTAGHHVVAPGAGGHVAPQGQGHHMGGYPQGGHPPPPGAHYK
ncbi:MAG: hypothetical protein M1823_005119 [Watsoniomyces obsoletus]|nr:MAG: hypothetical protein M1823_005119 [Watsoniomyces obsoletus]